PVTGSPPAAGPKPEPAVDHHGQQQHGADEEHHPVVVPAGVDDALLGHAVDERADHGADDGAVAAGEQAAADHRRHDVEQLAADALTGLLRPGGGDQVHAAEPGEEADRHEQADLDLGDRHADRAGAVRAAAHRVDPVPDPGAQQHPGGQAGEE